MTEGAETAAGPACSHLVAELRRRLGAVPKGRHAQAGPMRYDYRSIDDILDHVGPIARDLGLTLEVTEKAAAPLGGKQWMVKMRFCWIGPHGDRVRVARVSAVAMNLVAAQNIALRVALTQHLVLPTGADEEQAMPLDGPPAGQPLTAPPAPPPRRAPALKPPPPAHEPWQVPGREARGRLLDAAGGDKSIAAEVWGDRPKTDDPVEVDELECLLDAARQMLELEESI